MRIGIICPSEIATRRFLPALKATDKIEFAGVAVNSPRERYGEHLPDENEVQGMLRGEKEKAQTMICEYGGRLYDSYQSIISAPDLDAIYIPLPPALHFYWARQALTNGKHVLVEKPSTTSYSDSVELIRIARENNLALHENYMFIYHNQLDAIESIIDSGEIGDIRLYRISFGFPRRAVNDFRYNKTLGGGALIDAGGYTIKYAMRLLGNTAKIKYAQLNYIKEFDVDIYGSAALVNHDGITAQIAFGMDNDYKCELEVWGSKGTLSTGRVLTAPAGFIPTLTIKKNTTMEERCLPADDTFKKSIEHFLKCIDNHQTREANYINIIEQARLVNDFLEMASK